MKDQDHKLIDFLDSDLYVRAMHENVAEPTIERLQQIEDKKDLPFRTREMAALLRTEYDDIDECGTSGATLGYRLRMWHSTAWHFTETVHAMMEAAR